MVFTQFTNTMDFLREALRGEAGQTLRDEVGLQALREEHAESVELWSPGNPLFNAPELVVASDEPAEKEALKEILGG